MKIDVEVWCNKCDKGMIGNEYMFENTANKSQAREYTCETCDTKVGVALYTRLESRYGNPRVKVQ